jgi:hypothetical protein
MHSEPASSPLPLTLQEPRGKQRVALRRSTIVGMNPLGFGGTGAFSAGTGFGGGGMGFGGQQANKVGFNFGAPGASGAAPSLGGEANLSVSS